MTSEAAVRHARPHHHRCCCRSTFDADAVADAVDDVAVAADDDETTSLTTMTKKRGSDDGAAAELKTSTDGRGSFDEKDCVHLIVASDCCRTSCEHHVSQQTGETSPAASMTSDDPVLMPLTCVAADEIAAVGGDQAGRSPASHSCSDQ